jgi:hypothetical protein
LKRSWSRQECWKKAGFKRLDPGLTTGRRFLYNH